MPCVQQAAVSPAEQLGFSSGAPSLYIVPDLQSLRPQLGAPDHGNPPQSNLDTFRKTHQASTGHLLRVDDDNAPKLHNVGSAHRMSHSAWHCRIQCEGNGPSMRNAKYVPVCHTAGNNHLPPRVACLRSLQTHGRTCQPLGDHELLLPIAGCQWET